MPIDNAGKSSARGPRNTQRINSSTPIIEPVLIVSISARADCAASAAKNKMPDWIISTSGYSFFNCAINCLILSSARSCWFISNASLFICNWCAAIKSVCWPRITACISSLLVKAIRSNKPSAYSLAKPNGSVVSGNKRTAPPAPYKLVCAKASIFSASPSANVACASEPRIWKGCICSWFM